MGNWPVLLRMFGVVLLALSFCACKSPRRTEPVLGRQPATSPDLAMGRRAFDEHCHSCHPDGDGGLGPSLNDKPLPGTLIALQVRSGLGVMPSFPKEKIPPEELDALVEYMKALRRREL